MKFSVQPKNSSTSFFSVKDVLPYEEIDLIVQQGVQTLRGALLFELNHLALDVSLKEEIAHSIAVTQLEDGQMQLSIDSPAAADVEFGTRLLDEQPWVLRARHRASQADFSKIKSKRGQKEA